MTFVLFSLKNPYLADVHCLKNGGMRLVNDNRGHTAAHV